MSEISDAKEALKNARAALATASAEPVSSYSRPGLSVTRRSFGDMMSAIRYWENRVAELTVGFTSICDLSESSPSFPEAENS